MKSKFAAVLPLVLLGLVTALPAWCHDEDDYGRGCQNNWRQSNMGYQQQGNRRDWRDWRDIQRMERNNAYNNYNAGYNQSYNNYNPGYNNVGYGYNNGYNMNNSGVPISYRIRNWMSSF